MERLEGLPAGELALMVKFCQKSGFSGPQGNAWKDFVQALPAAQKQQDPARHPREQLLQFLGGVVSEAKQAKQLKRYAKWRAAVREELTAARQEQASSSGRGQEEAGDGQPAGKKPKTAKGKQQQKQQQQKQKEQQQEQEQPAAGGAAGAPAWRLVARTRAHPKFDRAYAFPSYEKGWLRTSRLRPRGAGGAAAPLPARPRLLALDCEMCETDRSRNALLSLAVVDENGDVVMRELVKPKGKILDLRTAITGIGPADLEGVTLRPRDAARRLAALLGPDTVLVGHSLSADLAALQIDHQPVIDTALLFSYKGLANATPSLVHLAKQLLGQELRSGGPAPGADGDGAGDNDGSGSGAAAAAGDGPAGGEAAGAGVHDSREDAAAAMDLVLFEMAKEAVGEATGAIEPPAVKVARDDLCKLLVHQLPASLASPQLAVTHAFGRAGAPPPAAVEAGSGPGQLLLVFANPAVANEAFAALPAQAGTDSVGRQQKQLELAGGVKVRVRKMAAHAGALFGRDARQDRGKAAANKAKRKQGAGSGGGRKRQREDGGGGGGAGGGGADGGGGEGGEGGHAEKRAARARRFREGLAK
ncbi:hypothetical protein Rsub_06524 [Raphidocelis subcapitata]|uniref:Exonuclease domain-containing protein n=1 Tax=Raphidocelis subcapitata TaxID=307507 RepID=A0A2V0P305_9CHLO|nr:hypothetical protein Rsub_06524 [Raphidocelis subcapitata]|eukprot:GBF94254.1 hypothetical protein Rsub_06524 [Raphidocelis subcapitata]